MIDTSKLECAIHSSPSSSSPGSKGDIPEFIKSQKSNVSPVSKCLFEDAYQKDKFPFYFRNMQIVMVLMPENEETFPCISGRQPITLLTVEYKVYAHPFNHIQPFAMWVRAQHVVFKHDPH